MPGVGRGNAICGISSPCSWYTPGMFTLGRRACEGLAVRWRKCQRGGGSAMTFEEIVDQAIAMLQRRGRVAYRMLKRQFQLDDDALEDLKTEIIKAQRLAVDEGGDVLVWTGGTTGPR